MSELSQYNDDGNVLTHGGLANRKKRGRNPLDYQDNKNKVSYKTLHFLTNCYKLKLISVPGEFLGQLS